MRRDYRITLALLTVAGISFALMQTLVLPALPFFQREFQTSANGVAWIATAFLLSSAVLTPILGKLGDAHGKQRLLVISLSTFGLASLGAALAPNLEALIACRVVQGAGGAVFPLSFGIIRDEFPPDKIGLGIGTVSSVFGAGGAIGLVLSGVIVQHLDWHWMFLMGGVPVIVAAVLIARFVPESPIRTPGRTDYAGGATLALALTLLLMAVSMGSRWGWASAGVLGLVSAAAILFAVWVAIERRVAAPFVDLRMFAHPGMAATNLATVLIGYTMFSAFILVPSLVQVPGVPPDGLAGGAETGFGASAIQTGLFFLPLSLAMIVAGPLSGVAADRFGRVLPLRAGLALTALGAGLFTVLRGEQWMVYAWMAVMGIGIALAMAAIASLVIDNSGPQETGVASGINAIMRMVGAALGSQVAAAVLSANTVEGTAIVTPAGYTIAFAAGAAGAALAVVPTWLLGGRGRHGHPAG